MIDWDKPSPLESNLQSKILEFAIRKRWFGGKVECKSWRGLMDLFLLRRGRTVWIEVKRTGEGARRQQQKRADEMIVHGAEVFIVDTLEEAMEILR